MFENWKGFVSLGPAIVLGLSTWVLIVAFLRWVVV